MPVSSPTGGPTIALPADLREAARTMSLMGFRDTDICAQYPAIKHATLRQWRNRDTLWHTAYTKANPASQARRLASDGPQMPPDEPQPVPNTIAQTDVTRRHTVLEKGLSGTLPDILARNNVRMAVAADASLGKFVGKDGTKAPKPRNWTETKTVYEVLRKATGADANESQVAQVQVSIWGNPGATVQTAGPAFRDVTPVAGSVTASQEA